MTEETSPEQGSKQQPKQQPTHPEVQSIQTPQVQQVPQVAQPHPQVSLSVVQLPLLL